MPRKLELSGAVFGRLTVTDSSSVDRCGKVQWVCRCSCGNIVSVVGSKLKSGYTKSCGCLALEVRTKHGNSRKSEYRIRLTMIQRCHNPKSRQYKDYGGRGITVCERWRESFDAFYADMGQRPSKDHSLERVDNNSGYCKENCKWATRKEQSRNMRSNVLLFCDGQPITVTDWASEAKVKRNTVYSRKSRGWTDPEVLSTPIQKRNRDV